MNSKRMMMMTMAVVLLCFTICPRAFALDISAGANPSSLSASGNVTLSLTFTNGGEHRVENITITNINGVSFETAGVAIDPGKSHQFTKTVTLPEGLIGQPLVFDVGWTENGEQMADSVELTVENANASGIFDPTTGAAAGISVTCTASATQASPGETIVLTYRVVNAGLTAVNHLSITDKAIAGKNPMVKEITVEAGAEYVFTYTYTMGKSTVTSAAVVDYTHLGGTAGKATAPEHILGMVNSRISVDVRQGIATEEGQTFTLVLTNNGNQKISKLKVTDELGSVVEDGFQIAIGESRSITYTVPTEAARVVVFNITGVDATGEKYIDKTKSYTVRKYIDPELIGIRFSAAVTETLNASGSISVSFTVENTGELTMSSLVLSESQLGEIYRLDSMPKGTEVIDQKINVGAPRDMIFTLDISDPSGNIYTYTANITAAYIGTEAAATATPKIEVEGDLVAEVGGSISATLRTVLIVLAVLTAIAAVALIVLSSLEREERRRMARRRAKRERMMREQAREQAEAISRGLSGAAPRGGRLSDGSGPTTRIPPTHLD